MLYEVITNTGLPPAIAGATLASLGILAREHERLKALWENGRLFRREMEARGRKAGSDTAIVPILVGTDGDTMGVSRALFDRGVFVHGIVITSYSIHYTKLYEKTGGRCDAFSRCPRRLIHEADWI